MLDLSSVRSASKPDPNCLSRSEPGRWKPRIAGVCEHTS
jgi:hypothetical protein